MAGIDSTISVEARVIGKRRSATTPWHVPLPPEFFQGTASAESAPRLRDLIEYIVRQEVRAFQQRQEERRLLHVLSARQIAEGASEGKVVMGGIDNSLAGRPDTEVDEEAAIQVALQGFLDGLYLVFLDGQQQQDLEAPVQISQTSTLLFLRLVALAGG